MICPKCKTPDLVPTAWDEKGPTRFFCEPCDKDYLADRVLLADAFDAMSTLVDLEENDQLLSDITSALERFEARLS